MIVNCSYISGGFGSTINPQIRSIVEETNVHGLAISVSNVIKLAETYRPKGYNHFKIREILLLDRSVLLADL